MRASSAARRSGVAKLPPSISRDQIMSASAARGCDHFLDRAAAAGAREIVGVLPFGQQRKAQALAGQEMRQREVGGAIGRLLPGAVAVETEDRLVRHLPEQRELVFGQRGAERRNGAAKARGDHGDDVDIAFDHDQRRAVMRGLPRGGEVVEIVALVKQRRFRRVQIFCRNVLFQRAAAEGDDAAARIRDRKHHAVAEAIVGHRECRRRRPAGPPRPCPRWKCPARRDAPSAQSDRRRRIAEAKLQLRRRRNARGRRDSRAPWRHCARPACRRRILPRAPSRHAASCGAARAARHRASPPAAPCRPSRPAARRLPGSDALGLHHEVEDVAVLAGGEVVVKAASGR